MKRFETQHGRSSPTASVIKRLLKSTGGPVTKSGERVLSQSRSQDDIVQLKNEPLTNNLAAIKLQDFSKGYKAQATIERQDSFEDLNDREHFVPRRELSAARKARQMRQQQRQQDQAQQLSEEQSQQHEHLEKASAYREILQQQILEKLQKK